MNDVWTTMDVGNLNLESTFGPFGKRKVVTNETGGVVITRDGQSVVPHCLRWVGNDFLKFLCMESVKMSSRSGDGLLTLIMIANYFLGKISESYEVSTFSMPSRIRSLRSIEAIRATAERFKSYIFDHLVLYGIWKQEIPYAERIRMLCSSVVVPSANKEIYNKISFIMVGNSSLSNLTPCICVDFPGVTNVGRVD